MTQIFDRFSILDPKRAEDQVESALGKSVFDRFSILDPARARAQVEAGAGKTIFDQYSALDPRRAEDQMEAAIGGGGDYVAKAVHVAGIPNPFLYADTELSNVTKYTAFCWVKVPAASANGASWSWLLYWIDNGVYSVLMDIAFNFSTDLDVVLSDDTGANYFEMDSANGSIPTDIWVPLFTTADTSQGTASGFVFANGVNVQNGGNQNGAPFTFGRKYIACPAGHPQGLGNDVNSHDIAQMQVWHGITIDPTNPTNYSKFVSGGKPVDPAIAAAAFGQQQILWDGDASANGFQKNKGSIGDVFSVLKTLGCTGHNGPGAISLPGAISGQSVSYVMDTSQNTLLVNSDFESVISVNNQIQQIGAPDYSTHALRVALPGAFTNASTSPSD